MQYNHDGFLLGYSHIYAKWTPDRHPEAGMKIMICGPRSGLLVSGLTQDWPTKILTHEYTVVIVVMH